MIDGIEKYDGCSDYFFASGTEILTVAPAGDEALKEIKKFISDYSLTQEDVKIVKRNNEMLLISKTDLTLTMLHKGDATSDSCALISAGYKVTITLPPFENDGDKNE